MDREIIKVPGVNNFRGLGGIKVGDKHFNNGLVYRSAGLHKIKKKGIGTLKELKITTVLDLRNENEQAQNKDPEIPFLKTLGFDFTGGALPGITREQLGEMAPSQFIKRAPRMEDLYAFILDENSNILVISSEGDTDPVRFREIIWDGLYGLEESRSI